MGTDTNCEPLPVVITPQPDCNATLQLLDRAVEQQSFKPLSPVELQRWAEQLARDVCEAGD